MNKLFKDGNYVLLSDCKAFDEKYGLDEDTTMWAVARKMECGEPDENYMLVSSDVICVGISDKGVGAWEGLVSEDSATKLTVEDVLYRSEDGLTLDELSEIQGAFEIGKKYKCVEGSCPSVYSINRIYSADVKGIKTNLYGSCSVGSSSKFKPVTYKLEPKPWTPSVGEEVMTSTGKYEVLLPVDLDNMIVISDNGTWVIQDASGCKPIDKERENTIKKVTDLAETLDDSYSTRDFAIALYDAGMLKEGDK